MPRAARFVSLLLSLFLSCIIGQAAGNDVKNVGVVCYHIVAISGGSSYTCRVQYDDATGKLQEQPLRYCPTDSYYYFRQGEHCHIVQFTGLNGNQQFMLKNGIESVQIPLPVNPSQHVIGSQDVRLG
ncbi:hypothetical protein DdX_20077 [Ditylenchus destructor]|uniref:Cuticular protein n=1 Tax=Ditylenchus destructor TaxID=166010 RepID=A0AAD4MGY2_9BILA|nr:hypothetical protein DdX_20077 [Ditylenchus destructor]